MKYDCHEVWAAINRQLTVTIFKNYLNREMTDRLSQYLKNRIGNPPRYFLSLFILTNT